MINISIKFIIFLLFSKNQVTLSEFPEDILQNSQMNRIKRQTDNSSNSNSMIQPEFPNDFEFFCDLRFGARSSEVPTSVHRLKPGDIDIVAAIGDSTTIAYGAFATNILESFYREDGVSWSIGGRSTWRKFFTLPNILKLYNPNLYGYALNEGFFYSKIRSGFNVAIAGVTSETSQLQAQILLDEMRKDPKLDVKNHWKLITYMLGAVDFCEQVCKESDIKLILNKAARNLLQALRFIKANFPRTIVNMVVPPYVGFPLNIRNLPGRCKPFLNQMCPCIFKAEFRQQTLDFMDLWKKQFELIAKLPEFHDSDDFEINLHPFLDETNLPTLPNGDGNLSYLSLDCFHFSQKGHAFLANSIWNSMLTPESQRLRALSGGVFEDVKCPTEDNPYFATVKNS